jgi:sulfopyruvate decarboxylase TPP-binding subunit
VLFPLASDPDIRLIRVCKEDEAIGIAMGLAMCDRRAVVLIQQTGFLDSINAIRVLAVEYAQPIVMVVGLQGKEADRAPRDSAKFAVRIVEPMIDVMGIRRDLLETRDDVSRIAPAIDTAYRDSRPVCLLVGRPPVAS